MLVSEIMSGSVSILGPDDSIQMAAQEMRRHNVGAIAVGQGQELAGILTDRDITVGCVADGHDATECHIVQHMSANPLTIAPGATAEEAAEQMGREQVRRLCVVDGGELQGIVSLGDLAVNLADSPALAQALAQISAGVRGPAVGAA